MEVLPQQNNMLCHTIKIVQEWPEEHDKKLKMLTWPPKSPDSNLFKYPWDVLVHHLINHRTQRILNKCSGARHHTRATGQEHFKLHPYESQDPRFLTKALHFNKMIDVTLTCYFWLSGVFLKCWITISLPG